MDLLPTRGGAPATTEAVLLAHPVDGDLPEYPPVLAGAGQAVGLAAVSGTRSAHLRRETDMGEGDVA